VGGGLVLIGVAALISCGFAPATDAATPQPPNRVSMWLPYVPTLLATVVCVPAFISVPGLGPIIFTAFVLVTIVLVRQFIVTGENRRLLATVADQALRDPLIHLPVWPTGHCSTTG
jgi:diguanylate cyclase